MKHKVVVAGLDDPENKKPAYIYINCLIQCCPNYFIVE